VSAYSLARATVVFSVVMLLAVRHRETRHPFARFGAANYVTTVRAALVSLAAGVIGEGTAPAMANAAVAASLAATMLDGVDGWLARRTRMASAFGARFDLETDALLIQVLAILAWQFGKAGVWVLASGLMRYVFVAAGWLWPWMRRPLPGSLRGKAVCIIQTAALILAIVPGVALPASAWLAAGGLTALCGSFFVDTRWLLQRRSLVSDLRR
jgi:phosphatidylglycerophosphate synthase